MRHDLVVAITVGLARFFRLYENRDLGKAGQPGVNANWCLQSCNQVSRISPEGEVESHLSELPGQPASYEPVLSLIFLF